MEYGPAAWGSNVKISIGSDHRGFPLKERIKVLLEKWEHDVMDKGCEGADSVDYPDYAFPVARMVAAGEADRGILVCCTGIGMSIAANKVQGVRASLCRTIDDAAMTRRHNDSNVLALSEISMDDPALEELVKVWLETPFEGGRHQRRVGKIIGYETGTQR